MRHDTPRAVAFGVTIGILEMHQTDEGTRLGDLGDWGGPLRNVPRTGSKGGENCH